MHIRTLFGIFVLFYGVFAQNTGNFSLKGEIAFWDKNDSCEVILFNPDGRKKEQTTFTDAEGKFSFHTEYSYQDASRIGEYTLLITSSDRQERIGVPIFIEPGKKLSVFVAHDTLIYKGSELQEAFSRFEQPLWKYYVKQKDYEKEYPGIPAKFLAEQRKFRNEYIREYATKNPDKIFIYKYIDIYYRDKDGEFLERMCSEGQRYFADNVHVQNLCIRTEGRKLEEGKKSPDFTLKDASGKEISLRDYKGKYVLLYFWASWCSPCVKGIPKMQEIYQEFRSDDFELICLSLDVREERWKKALQKLTPPGIQVLATREAADKYGVRYIPFLVLINPDGIIEKYDVSKVKIRRYLKRKLH